MQVRQAGKNYKVKSLTRSLQQYFNSYDLQNCVTHIILMAPQLVVRLSAKSKDAESLPAPQTPADPSTLSTIEYKYVCLSSKMFNCIYLYLSILSSKLTCMTPSPFGLSPLSHSPFSFFPRLFSTLTQRLTSWIRSRPLASS
jgi:hypothetical protein